MKDAKSKSIGKRFNDFVNSNHIISGENITLCTGVGSFFFVLFTMACIQTGYNFGKDYSLDKLIRLRDEALAQSCNPYTMNYTAYSACKDSIDKKYFGE